MIFPDDDNGDVLRRLASKGDDLTQPRDIDFIVVFRDQGTAEQFAERFRTQGYKATVTGNGPAAEFPWDVLVVKHMIPTYEAVGAFEAALQQAASPLDGHNDGWGCVTQAGPL